MYKLFFCLSSFAALVICTVIFTSPAHAEASKCSVRDTNDFTVVVVCPEGLDQSGWRDAGAEACGSLKPCAAWIWTDPEMAPKKAPSTPTLLSQAQVANTTAIWVNEKQELIIISRDKK